MIRTGFCLIFSISLLAMEFPELQLTLPDLIYMSGGPLDLEVPTQPLVMSTSKLPPALPLAFAEHMLSNPCPNCSKYFRTKQQLAHHIRRMHTGIKPFICDRLNCTNAYSTQRSLALHVLRKHKPATYCCKWCDKKYTMKCDLNQHYLRSHHKKA